MSDVASKKSKITHENLDESARLLEIWNQTYQKRKEVGLHTQGAFGDVYGIGNQAAVGFFLAGKTALSKKAAKGFATGLGCKIEDFSPRLAAEIADLSVSVATGKSPEIEELEEVVTRLTTSGKMQLTEVSAMIAMLKAREGSDQANKSPGSVGTSAEKNQKSSDAPQMPDFLKKHGSN